MNKIGEATEFEGDTYAKKYIKILMQPKKKQTSKNNEMFIKKKIRRPKYPIDKFNRNNITSFICL